MAFRTPATYLLNATLFVLTGLPPAAAAAAAGARARVLNSVAGFRGVVSWAAALAVPRTAGSGGDTVDEPALRSERPDTALRLAVLAHKRATVVRLRDEGRIDDPVLRQVRTKLDIEEVRLSRRAAVD